MYESYSIMRVSDIMLSIIIYYTIVTHGRKYNYNYFIEAAIKGDITAPFRALQILENTGLKDTIGAIWVPVLSGMYTHVSMFECHVRTCHVRTCRVRTCMFEHDVCMFEGRQAGKKNRRTSTLKVPQNLK